MGLDWTAWSCCLERGVSAHLFLDEPNQSNRLFYLSSPSVKTYCLGLCMSLIRKFDLGIMIRGFMLDYPAACKDAGYK